MKIKDSTIILLLILTWIFLFCVMLGTENEISNITELLERIEVRQEEQALRIADMERMNESQETRLYDIEQVNRVQDLRLDIHRETLQDNAKMFTDLLDSVEHLEEYMRSLPDNVLGVEVSEQDIRDISALVYLEAGSGSYELQKAIASVIFNRMIRYNMTAQQVIYQRGVFTPANRVRSTTPSSMSQMATREVLETGTTLPRSVVAFRTNHYHDFGTHYGVIDGIYFTAI